MILMEQRDVAEMTTSIEITKSGSADFRMMIVSMKLIEVYSLGATTIEFYE